MSDAREVVLERIRSALADRPQPPAPVLPPAPPAPADPVGLFAERAGEYRAAVHRVDRSGVAVRAGTHCAMPLLARYGVTSTCRASFAMYNTMDEVDALAEALAKAEALFA